jgi:hypothetical protein
MENRIRKNKYVFDECCLFVNMNEIKLFFIFFNKKSIIRKHLHINHKYCIKFKISNKDNKKIILEINKIKYLLIFYGIYCIYFIF